MGTATMKGSEKKEHMTNGVDSDCSRATISGPWNGAGIWGGSKRYVCIRE